MCVVFGMKTCVERRHCFPSACSSTVLHIQSRKPALRQTRPCPPPWTLASMGNPLPAPWPPPLCRRATSRHPGAGPPRAMRRLPWALPPPSPPLGPSHQVRWRMKATAVVLNPIFSSVIHRSHSISLTRAQGVPKYKIGFWIGCACFSEVVLLQVHVCLCVLCVLCLCLCVTVCVCTCVSVSL